MSERDEITRREFIEKVGVAAVAATVGAGCGDGADGADGADGGGGDSGGDGGGGGKDDWSIPEGMAAVSIVGRDDVETAVRRAIEMAGDLDEIGAGDRVFVKPNCVHPYTGGLGGIVTSPEALAAVVRVLKERKAHVTVGDRSARGFASYVAFDMTGLGQAAMDAGADEVFPAPTPDEAPEEWVMLRPPAWEETWAEQGGILAMRRIVEADHLVSVPVCKDHRWAAYSMAMKTFIGAVGDPSREPLHYKEFNPDRLSRDIAILGQMFAPRLTVLDAWTALVNGGPEGVLGDDVRVEPRLVMASRDRIALDAAGASLIKLWLSRVDVPDPDPMYQVLTTTAAWSLPQIVYGAKRGLGVDSPDRVSLRFDGAKDAAEIESIFRAA